MSSTNSDMGSGCHERGKFMLRLFQLGPAWGLADFSPACMKIEAWLRIASIAYESRQADFGRAPKGKVPYVEIDELVIGDSTLIIEHLVKTTGIDPDRSLSSSERAVSLSFRRMMNEHFYWVLIHDRWGDDHNFTTHYQPLLLSRLYGHLPADQKMPALLAFREVLKAQLHHQGMGRHTAEEIHRMGMADVKAVSDFLGTKPFLMGDEPTTGDAAVHALLANVLEAPFASPVKDFGLDQRNVVDYLGRMRERFFPELARG